MGDTLVKEDETVELTKIDGDLKADDGAIINVPSDTLIISGDLISKGDVLINGAVEVKDIRHDRGYLEIQGNVKARHVRVSSRKASNGSKLIITGSLNCEEIDVDGGLEVDENLTSGDVDIGDDVTIVVIKRIK